MHHKFKRLSWAAAVLVAAASARAAPVHAQPSWIMPDILAAAKAEGELTIYASMNEEEALPYWKVFEDATGIKVNFVRSSDANIRARIAIEARAMPSNPNHVSMPAISGLSVDPRPRRFREGADH